MLWSSVIMVKMNMSCWLQQSFYAENKPIFSCNKAYPAIYLRSYASTSFFISSLRLPVANIYATIVISKYFPQLMIICSQNTYWLFSNLYFLNMKIILDMPKHWSTNRCSANVSNSGHLIFDDDIIVFNWRL